MMMNGGKVQYFRERKLGKSGEMETKYTLRARYIEAPRMNEYSPSQLFHYEYYQMLYSIQKALFECSAGMSAGIERLDMKEVSFPNGGKMPPYHR